MMVTDALRPASSVASNTADVDLPAPPFELANEIVGMSKTLTDGSQAVNSLVSDDSQPTVV
jgi:hypothetical protein